MHIEPRALSAALRPLRAAGSMNLKSTPAPPEISRGSYDAAERELAITPGPISPLDGDAGPGSASVSRTPSDSSISSCSAVSVTASASEHDGTSLFESGGTTSTHHKSEEETGEIITIVSSSNARRPRPLSIDLSPASLPARSDEDWAKDARWLVPPSFPDTPPARPRPKSMSFSDSQPKISRPIHPDLLPLPIIPAPHHFDRQMFPDLTGIPLIAPSRPRIKEHGSRKNSPRQSRVRMSALWEEDESTSSAEPSRASTPAPVSSVEGYVTAGERSATPPLGWPYAGIGADPSPSSASPDAQLHAYAQARPRPSRLRSLSFSNTSAPSLGSPDFPTLAIPAPVPEPSGASSGYTGLTLPHASYTPKIGKPLADGHIDLVRSGRAQSSMATVEVVRGAANSSSAFTKLLRRKRKREGATPAHLRDTLPLPVAFTSHVPPPSFVPAAYVLVQVFAAGLDGLDSMIVQEKADKRSVAATLGKKRGFVPGRSIVGKVMECGFEVNSEVCRRGDWVLGLLDVRKCGALAEFVLVERHRVFRSPAPRERPTSLFPPRKRKHTHTRTLSLPSSVSSSPPSSRAPLTLEELALLPLCGLPAYRAVRTFTDVISSRRNRESPWILILNGHDGPGALAVQMLGKKRARLCVQVPESAMSEPKESSEPSEESSKTPGSSRHDKVVARVRGWGAEEVCVGDPLAVLETFVEEERSFDGVLDTVGGVFVWEASQRLLSFGPNPDSPSTSLDEPSTPESSSEPSSESSKKKNITLPVQFTTLMGDVPSRVIPTAHDNLRSGLRSLRRSTVTSSSSSTSTSRLSGTLGKSRIKRIIGYTWVSVASDVEEGEDVRYTLGAVVEMVGGGAIRPWAGQGEDDERVVPFERAPEVFRRDAVGPRGVLKDGGTCVIKIGGA
ncbi:uncharacterized protein LAESUDRAFT_733278 [Laetiporus sulphureus 93-53]|uniref:Uncharacterized protein n=1 Tax=Laetiporus sulphureus 93-53 TaxID=1314785 RepID=A0A165I639_9APHY|nr:uncharacterized protein LAESUDRAFT_733278 [Laetiporus sulphureus 93-53]KZT12641.1 hypothetical protein LAESUDRAFT_733278 [Laetiporus sulphureus 93-53]